jgi:cobalt/nickel transport system ATP-binding protein
LIISTHDVDLAYRWADEVILMKDGGVLRRGSGPEVFGDSELIKEARLKLPIVVDLYQELAGRGLVDGPKPPRNILELCDTMEQGCKGRAPSSSTAEPVETGKIYICNVDELEAPQIIAILEKIQPSCKGAMGTSAKVMAEEAGIALDFTYGVIDKCILKALIGKSSLIMTSGGMVDHAQNRIRDYCRESGAVIEAVRLSDGAS